MKIRPLFIKYQPALLKFVNTGFGKDFLGIKSDSEIIKITPDGWHSLKDIDNEREIIQATFYPGSPYLKVFGPFLQMIEKLNWAKEFALRMPDKGAYLIDSLMGNPNSMAFPLVLGSVEFNPNAHPESTSVDGYARRNVGTPEPWATLRGGAGISADDTGASETTRHYVSSGGNAYEIRRNFFLFDTSSLDDTQSIISAILSLAGGSKSSAAGEQDMNIVSATPASNTAIVAADYSQVGSTSFAYVAYANLTTGGSYTNFTLDANGIANISKTGISKFALRTGHDLLNSTPSGTQTYSDWFHYHSDNGSIKPKLVITVSSIKKFGGVSYASIKKAGSVSLASIKKVGQLA